MEYNWREINADWKRKISECEYKRAKLRTEKVDTRERMRRLEVQSIQDILEKNELLMGQFQDPIKRRMWLSASSKVNRQ